MIAVEAFAGAGGAALGLRAAGLHSVACVEWDEAAVQTLTAAGLPGMHADVRDWTRKVGRHLRGVVRFLWGSPPCQAFSSAGKRLGARDPRNGWPWTLDLVDAVRPEWAAFENVPGLLSHRRKAGCDKGRHPKPLDCPGCYWTHEVVPAFRARFAWVGVWTLNAADYGVPQKRKRVFLVAGPRPVEPPEPTHSEVALTRAKWVTGDYWRAVGLEEPVGEPTRSEARILKQDAEDDGLLPWVTIRQALGLGAAAVRHQSPSAGTVQTPIDAPSPAVGGKGTLLAERERHDGSHNPAYHRPELADLPAPAVTTTEVKGTRGGGMSGGPDRASDALWLATGRRRLTPEECAALQGFPAGYPFQGTKTAQYRQIGNAVPPKLAEVVAVAVMKAAQEPPQ